MPRTFIPRRRRKFGNKKTVYNGVTYHSMKEAAYAKKLDAMKERGEIYSWIGQHPISLKLNNKLVCKYVIDFVIFYKEGDGRKYVEVKGFETDVWKLKWALFCALYPDVDKEIVK